MLHEALTARADPLHLALVFGLSHTTASKYTLIACDLLADQPAEAAEAAGKGHYAPDAGRSRFPEAGEVAPALSSPHLPAGP